MRLGFMEKIECKNRWGGISILCMSLRTTSPDRERSDERFSVTPCAKMLTVRSRALARSRAVFSDVDFFLSPWGIGKKVYNTNSQTARTGPRLWPEHARYIHTPQSMMYKETQAGRQASKVALLKREKSIIIALANARNQRIKKCFSFIRRQTSWLSGYEFLIRARFSSPRPP
jgi:hypothetical protein